MYNCSTLLAGFGILGVLKIELILHKSSVSQRSSGTSSVSEGRDGRGIHLVPWVEYFFFMFGIVDIFSFPFGRICIIWVFHCVQLLGSSFQLWFLVIKGLRHSLAGWLSWLVMYNCSTLLAGYGIFGSSEGRAQSVPVWEESRLTIVWSSYIFFRLGFWSVLPSLGAWPQLMYN